MKIKANKQVQVTTKIDFSVGDRVKIETKKINLRIKEVGGKIVINFPKPYRVDYNKKKEIIIHPSVIRKPRNMGDKLIPNIENYLNWSEISRLLSGNTSTIRRGYIPKKKQERIDELLKLVNKWVLEQKQQL